MRRLARDEIVDLDRYEALRAEYRARVIALKRHRRVAVGDRVTLLFENRETLRFQVQEMLRIERIYLPEGVQAELDVYNELMPGAGELSATLFIEITESSQIKPELDRLVGIEQHLALVLGEDADERLVRPRFDPRQREEDRISAVQYLRFGIEPDLAAQLRDGVVRARLRIDHPHYRSEAEIAPSLRAQLLADLAGGDPTPLLDAGVAAAPRALEHCLLETAAVRVLRPARGSVVIVECRAPVSLTDAGPQLLAEVFPVLQRFAREIVQEFGACRVACDVEHANAPMRWQLQPPQR